MKIMLMAFIALLVSVWAGTQMNSEPGYVLVAFQEYTLQMTLWVAMGVLLLTFLVLYLVVRFFKQIGGLKMRFSHWRRRWRIKRAHSQTSRGLIEFTEGNWAQAEKYLLKALTSSDTPLINYLAAARAAQEQGASRRRDQYLCEAQRAMPDAKVAIELTQAQLQIANGQYEQALATLRHLQSMVPKHAYVLKLLNHVYCKLYDWESLREILPKLKRYKVLRPEEIHQTEVQTYQGLLAQAAKSSGTDAIERVWTYLPRAQARDPLLVYQYASMLIERNAGVQAEQVLHKSLKNSLDNTLLELYGQAKGRHLNKQLAFIESWLKEQPSNPDLLFCAARLSLKNQLWGKARTYLENSLSLEVRPEACAELAQLLDRLGEHVLATQYYRQGLDMIAKIPEETLLALAEQGANKIAGDS